MPRVDQVLYKNSRQKFRNEKAHPARIHTLFEFAQNSEHVLAVTEEYIFGKYEHIQIIAVCPVHVPIARLCIFRKTFLQYGDRFGHIFRSVVCQIRIVHALEFCGFLCYKFILAQNAFDRFAIEI